MKPHPCIAHAHTGGLAGKVFLGKFNLFKKNLSLSRIFVSAVGGGAIGGTLGMTAFAVGALAGAAIAVLVDKTHA